MVSSPRIERGGGESPLRLSNADAYREHLRERCRTIGRALGLVVLLVGVLASIGVITHVPALMTFGADTTPMRATGAVAAMIFGVAIWLTPRRAFPTPTWKTRTHLALMSLGLTSSIGCLVLIAMGVKLEVTLSGSILTGMLAVGALCQHIAGARGGRATVTLASIGGAGAMVFAISQIFSSAPVADPFGQWLPLPAIVTITVGAFASLLLVPEHGLLGYATRSSAASELLRVMLPAIVLGPIVPGFVVNLAVRNHVLEPGLGFAILVCSMVFMLGALLAWSASRITRGDEGRTHELALTSNRHRVVLDGVNAAIVYIRNRTIADANRTCLQWLGRSSEEVVGHSPSVLHDREDTERLALAYQARHQVSLEHPILVFVPGPGEDGPRVTECFYRRKDGSRFPVLLSVSRIVDASSKVNGFVGIAIDISMQRAAEAALVQAKNAAESSMRARADFLARMSHEIRTPLNGVLGLTALALETQLDSEQREYVGGAREAAASLLGLIDDILDFSKIDAGKLAIETISIALRQVLTGAIRTLALKARAKGLVLRIDVPETVPDKVLGDPTRLTQVIVNLVGNAIKFTEKGEVLLGIEVVEVAGERVTLRFRVEDTGIGIPADKQAHVFEAFSQADEATTRKFGGTGLGLAISAQLVQMMGGRLAVTSTVGQGSTFSFTLPFTVRRSSHQTPIASPKLRAPPVRALNVLVAEDNPVNLVLVTRLLERAGHSVTGVSDGRRAVEHATSGAFDAVLMDVQMPELDGLEATRAIRASEGAGVHVPIVGLTAQAMAGDDQKCLEAGMDAYLSKPFEAHALLAVLDRVSFEMSSDAGGDLRASP